MLLLNKVEQNCTLNGVKEPYKTVERAGHIINMPCSCYHAVAILIFSPTLLEERLIMHDILFQLR